MKVQKKEEIRKYYFTFGSDERFPYQNGYLVIYAKDMSEAVRMFRDKYPDRNEGIINCSFYYSQAAWDSSTKRYYKGETPKDVLISPDVDRSLLSNDEYSEFVRVQDLNFVKELMNDVFALEPEETSSDLEEDMYADFHNLKESLGAYLESLKKDVEFVFGKEREDN